MPLADTINLANRFWQRIRADRLGVSPDDVVMPKRKRPVCLCDKPHIKIDKHGRWVCSFDHEGYTFIGHGSTPAEALERISWYFYCDLDLDRINSGDFIYIDSVLVCFPLSVFHLLPQEIQDHYEPLESSTK